MKRKNFQENTDPLINRFNKDETIINSGVGQTIYGTK